MKLEWMLCAGARLALVSTLWLGACGGERSPLPPPPAPAPTAAPARPDRGGPPAMPGRIMRITAPISDVATLQLQPDGSYKRVCGTPNPEQRAMLEGVMRARRAAK